MSVTAFMILVFGTCAVVTFIWWVMLKALTSRKSIHTGPVEHAARARSQTRHNPSAQDHADDHFDHWQDDLQHETAAEAEWSATETLPRADDEIRQGLDTGPSPVTEIPPAPESPATSESGTDSNKD